jgi:uncharacterized protein YndB with AHSA1/START domain
MSDFKVTVEPGRHDIIITRTFDAPRDLVFKTMTDPKAIPNWWGPRQYTTEVDQMDARSGGAWRFINRDADGNEFGFHGVYHDLVPGERIIQTFEWEGLPGHVSLETSTLEEAGGKTLMSNLAVFQTIEDRDGMASAMGDGASETFDRLAELVEKARVS